MHVINFLHCKFPLFVLTLTVSLFLDTSISNLLRHLTICQLLSIGLLGSISVGSSTDPVVVLGLLNLLLLLRWHWLLLLPSLLLWRGRLCLMLGLLIHLLLLLRRVLLLIVLLLLLLLRLSLLLSWNTRWLKPDLVSSTSSSKSLLLLLLLVLLLSALRFGVRFSIGLDLLLMKLLVFYEGMSL